MCTRPFLGKINRLENLFIFPNYFCGSVFTWYFPKNIVDIFQLISSQTKQGENQQEGFIPAVSKKCYETLSLDFKKIYHFFGEKKSIKFYDLQVSSKYFSVLKLK